MNARLRILYLPHLVVSETALPLRQRLASLLHGRYEILVFDQDRALAPQFRDVDVVVDPGGAAGTRPMADAATSVQLWQIVGTGFDHFGLSREFQVSMRSTSANTTCPCLSA